MSPTNAPRLNPDVFDYCMDTICTARGITLDENTRGVWYASLQGIDGKVLAEAVDLFIADEGYPSLALLRRMCGDIARQRLAAATQPSPPAGLDTDEYMRWNAEWRRQVVRGESPDVAQAAAIEAIKAPAALPSAPGAAPGAVGFPSSKVL